MEKTKLFVATTCPFCKKVEKFMEENDISLPIVNIDNDEQARQELVKNGGKRQVPCLLHDGTYLYESEDIISRLKENYL